MVNLSTDEMKTGSREMVAFRVAGQDYCVDIMAVREIRGWSTATSLPHAPTFVRGVINLRGSVVPIVDLAARLGLGSIEPSERNVIIIAVINRQVVGLLVEAVFDILSVDIETIQQTPEVASEIVRAFIEGVVTADEKMLRLLDLQSVLPAKEFVAA